ncbi:uncharacterized protein CC84DRAFT_268927 [Paraphaeosphaeria sporulosa]|uniref:Uncharacterized protein n=1 Tax=Paraphaeosphaeria sporulosa TaxID=1460663 RepID=A0A177C201_9PLEO|nr:uncharacterized protein CC84DRAFT_268927 [Paraphaeosphaeria sporulosa]OAG00872.1 hypothetical protein CC84DRAFT_268927 [Paraphaeosphaeria sporulosa]
MPLPNPWKMPSTPSSPPSLRRKTSLRHRNKARLGFLVLIAVLTVYAFNELRCMHYGCLSRVGFYGAGVDRAGGATLPEDWKYRLGEQLKMNMQAQAQVESHPPHEHNKEDIDKQKEEDEEKENGALIEPLTVTPTIDPGVLHAGDSDRWIDAPPGPVAPEKDVKEQMQADKQTYVDVQGIDAPPARLNKPPAEASEHLAAPSPGVQVSAEDLRVAGKADTGAGKDAAKKEDVPEPPKLDKTKEKVDSVIAQKTVPKASSPASQPAPSSPPASKAEETLEDIKAHAKLQSHSQPHTHDALGTNANTFGSMEMGQLMGGR